MKDILGYEGIYQISDDYTNIIRLPYDVEQDGRWGKYKELYTKRIEEYKKVGIINKLSL